MLCFQPDYPCSKKPTKILVLSLYPLLLPYRCYMKTTPVSSFAVYIGYYFISSWNSMDWIHQQKLQPFTSVSSRTAVSSPLCIILLLFSRESNLYAPSNSEVNGQSSNAFSVKDSKPDSFPTSDPKKGSLSSDIFQKNNYSRIRAIELITHAELCMTTYAQKPNRRG